MIISSNSLSRGSGMPFQVDGAILHAMSGTELSRVRTELRLLLREHINQRLLASRAADIVMQSSAFEPIHLSGNRVNQELRLSGTSASVMVSNVQFFEPENWSLANMMRVRGAIVLAAGVPFWVYLVRFTNEVRKSPFGYEFGSVAFPPPPQFRAAQFVAVISFLLGLYLLVADFINWVKKRPHGRPH